MLDIEAQFQEVALSSNDVAITEMCDSQILKPIWWHLGESIRFFKLKLFETCNAALNIPLLSCTIGWAIAKDETKKTKIAATIYVSATVWRIVLVCFYILLQYQATQRFAECLASVLLLYWFLYLVVAADAAGYPVIVGIIQILFTGISSLLN